MQYAGHQNSWNELVLGVLKMLKRDDKKDCKKYSFVENQ